MSWVKIFFYFCISCLLWVFFVNYQLYNDVKIFCSYLSDPAECFSRGAMHENGVEKNFNFLMDKHIELFLTFKVIVLTDKVKASYCLEESSCFSDREGFNKILSITNFNNLNNSLINEIKNNSFKYGGYYKKEYDKLLKENNISQKESVFCIVYGDCDEK